VLLEDVMPSNLHHAEEYLRQQLGPAALPMVEFASTIEGAVRGADLAIDCVPDELESKLEIFCLLDRMAPPRTVLITPTTRLSIADLASCTYRADKCVALVADAKEFTRASIGNDPGEKVLREVLLRTAPLASSNTIAIARDFFERIGFAPRFEPDLSQ
jgi:3-hydroxybutyryl-CoA dehydrogenase